MNDTPSSGPRAPSMLWLGLPLLVFSGAVALTALLLDRDPPPPVLRRLPSFSLIKADKRPFGSRELRDRAWVANVFFTRCHSICPKLMDDVRKLGEALDDRGLEDVALVSISVDPDHDTPALLTAYAEKRGMDPDRWILLTGDTDPIRKLVVGGFATDVGAAVETGPGLIDIAHTAKLILVDGEGRIRGYYDPDPPGRDRLVGDAKKISN